MKKITYLLLVVLVALLAAAFVGNPRLTRPGPDDPDEALVRRVHHDAFTFDAHLDIRPDFNTPENDAGNDTPDQFDLPKLEKGDLDAAAVALFADPLRRTPENIALARQQVETKLAALRRLVTQHPDRLAFATTAAELERIPGQGKHAILLSFLNALPLGKDLSLLEYYHRQGVRLFGFTHAGNNDFADSSRPNAAFGDKPDEAGGLTPVGKQAVAELNRLGVIIDVSQLTRAGVLQTIQLSKAPVVASHSAVRGRVEKTRNLTNEELKAIAAGGGVVHIVAFPAYLRDNPQQKTDYVQQIWAPFGLTPGTDDPKTELSPVDYQQFQQAYRAYSGTAWKYGTLVDYLDAVDYAVRLVGINHVGLSSDFNHGGGVTGYTHVGEAPNVTRELLKRGYSEADIRKLWGGNFLRVFRQVEGLAKNLPSGNKVTKN